MYGGVTRGAQVTGIVMCSLSLTWISTILRFYVRISILKFVGREDWLTIAAMVNMAPQSPKSLRWACSTDSLHHFLLPLYAGWVLWTWGTYGEYWCWVQTDWFQGWPPYFVFEDPHWRDVDHLRLRTALRRLHNCHQTLNLCLFPSTFHQEVPKSRHLHHPFDGSNLQHDVLFFPSLPMYTNQLSLDAVRGWARYMSEVTDPRKRHVRTLCNVSTYRLVVRHPANLLRVENADDSSHEAFRHLGSFFGLFVGVAQTPTQKSLTYVVLQCKHSNNRQDRLHQKPHQHRRLLLGRHQSSKMVHGGTRYRHNGHEHRDAAAHVQ